MQCWQACVRVYDAVWRGAVSGDTQAANQLETRGKGEESDKTTNSVLKALQHTGAVPCVCWVPGILLAPRWEDTTSVVARLLTED